MPAWLRNTLVGLVIFTLTLRMGLLPQFVVCALTLGVAVWQIWGRRARWLWTWMSLVAVALFLLGVYLAGQTAPAWFLYFGAWIFVIVALRRRGLTRHQGAAGDVDELTRSAARRSRPSPRWPRERVADAFHPCRQVGRAGRRCGGVEETGARSRIRTADPLLTMEVLCQLS